MKYSILVVLFSAIFSFSLQSQEKVSNKIFRTMKDVFLIENSLGETRYRMSKSSSGEFHFKVLSKKEIKDAYKIANSDAQNLDDEFVKNFISLKYMMEAYKNKKCRAKFNLNMRGEVLSICEGDKARVDIVENFIKKLKGIIK